LTDRKSPKTCRKSQTHFLVQTNHLGTAFIFILFWRQKKKKKKKKRTKNLSNAALHFLDYFPHLLNSIFSIFIRKLHNTGLKKSLIFDDGQETHL